MWDMLCRMQDTGRLAGFLNGPIGFEGRLLLSSIRCGNSGGEVRLGRDRIEKRMPFPYSSSTATTAANSSTEPNRRVS